MMLWRHDVMSWRHKNLIYLSQLVDVLESWFFFCFYGFLGHWVRICYWFFHFCDHVTSWRHVMTSQNLIYLSQLCRCARKLILFLFLWFFRSLSSNLLLIFHLCDHVTSWRHVIDVTKPDLPISACRCARKLILFLFLWFFRSLSSNLLLIFHLCDHVTSWRHVMTSQNLIYLSQLVDVLESWFFFCFYGF